MGTLTITNLTTQNQSVGNVYVQKGQAVTVDSKNIDINALGTAVAAGVISVTPAFDGAVATLTDNSGGTASDTIAVIGATYSQAEVANAVASLVAKINVLAAQVAALGGTSE